MSASYRPFVRVQVESWGLFEQLRAKRQRLTGSDSALRLHCEVVIFSQACGAHPAVMRRKFLTLCAGQRTRRSAEIRSVRNSFRQGARRTEEPYLIAVHHSSDRSTAQPAAAEADRGQSSSRGGTAAVPVATPSPSQQTAHPRAADLHREGPIAGTARAAALRRHDPPSLTAAQQGGASLAAAAPRDAGAGAVPAGLRGGATRDSGEQQAGLVPYSSSEGSEETLSDAIVISDKIVSAAATNTAALLGDDVRGFGSDDVSPNKPLNLWRQFQKHFLLLSARFYSSVLPFCLLVSDICCGRDGSVLGTTALKLQSLSICCMSDDSQYRQPGFTPCRACDTMHH